MVKYDDFKIVGRRPRQSLIGGGPAIEGEDEVGALPFKAFESQGTGAIAFSQPVWNVSTRGNANGPEKPGQKGC